MALQTAPNTLTVATTGGDSVFSLFEVTDSMITYRGVSFNGVNYAVNEQPLLTFTRKTPGANSSSTKFQVRLKHTVFDALGNRVSDQLEVADIVLPTSYMTHANAVHSRMEEAFALVLKDTFVKTMVLDGSWAR